MIDCLSNGKAMIIRLIVGLIKKISLYKRIYFPEPSSQSKNKIKIELGLLKLCNKIWFRRGDGHRYIKIC